MRHRRWTLLLVLGCMVSAADAVGGAEYETLPLNPRSRPNFGMTKLLRGEEPLQGNESRLDAYFVEYVFPELTLPENLGKIPELRQVLFRRWLRDSNNTPQVRTHLNELTLREMKRLIAGNFHPAVRYNAVLIIGDLDEELAVDVGNRRAPVPYGKAVEVLLVIVSRNDGRLPDALKAAALVGLVRHATHGMLREHREKVTETMLQLLAEKNPPNGREPMAHDWLRRRAADVLGALGEPGSQGAVARPLMSVMNDTNESLVVRATAADALASLKYSREAVLDVKAFTAGLGELALAACRHASATTRGGGEPPSRRRLAQQLNSVGRGLIVAKSLSDASNQALVEQLKKSVDDVLANLPDDARLAADLGPRCEQLEVALGKTKPSGPTDKEKSSSPADEFGAAVPSPAGTGS